MMLRWISLVPPMIELARDASRPSTHRPPSTAAASSGASSPSDPAPRPRSRRAAGSCRPRRASRGSIRHRSPRRARGGPACAGCAAGRSRARSTTGRAAGAATGSAVAPRDAHVCSRRSMATSAQHLLLPDERGAALVGQRRVRHPPALVLGPDAVLDRNLDVVEEDLVELALPGDLAQRSDLHARPPSSGSRASRSPGAAARRDRCAPARWPSWRSARTTTTPSDRSRGRRRRAAPRASRGSPGHCPASGSLNSWHQTSSPARIRGSSRPRCSSVPCAIRVGPTRVMPARPRTPGACARASSSL